MPGDPQEDVLVLNVPFDFQLSLTTSDEAALLCVPHGKNMQVEVISVGFTGLVIPTAASVDLEWRDCLREEDNGLRDTVGGFVPSNVVEDRVLDCDNTTYPEVADILGTLIADLKIGLPLPLYTLTNVTRALAHNCNANSLALLADQVAQLIDDINDNRIVDVVFSNKTVDRTFDADSTTVLELADIAASLHDDLTPTADLVASVDLITQGIEGYVSLWNGSLVLNQGDLLNLEIDCSDSTQDGEGYSALVEYRVLRHSGG
ncbi:hypothetical protein LCGC14_1034910 [marine sediment metagenome]|uniref:Uncharacterized protein n=1 Tax=marine sediment metagenome TaxID=412755 RepID=A0A0F9QZJ9_9ZZZZ